MKIKNLTITSPSVLDLELDITSPVCLLYGKHSELALDLIRELIGDYSAKTDPDCYDDGHFVIHSDIEMDGKNYNVCYIRNADFMGDNRIAANFVPNSFEYSEEDTLEFLDKCKTRNKDLNNVVYNYKIFSIAEDNRPLFIYCEDAEAITPVIEFISTLNRQVFVAITSNKISSHSSNIQTAFVG